MTELIKLIAIIIALTTIAKTYLDYRKKRESLVMLIFWTIIWVAATTVVVYPVIIEKISFYTRDYTFTLGSVISLAFIFMLFIIYRVYAKAARIEYQVTQLARKVALNTKELNK